MLTNVRKKKVLCFYKHIRMLLQKYDDWSGLWSQWLLLLLWSAQSPSLSPLQATCNIARSPLLHECLTRRFRPPRQQMAEPPTQSSHSNLNLKKKKYERQWTMNFHPRKVRLISNNLPSFHILLFCLFKIGHPASKLVSYWHSVDSVYLPHACNEPFLSRHS